MASPDFIRFLFSKKPKFDCYFSVGNKEKPERIGGVKLMLMAHSEVFRLELEESELAEKEDVSVEDIHPSTFRAMLKYVYGHDLTAGMDFDEADNLLYVAEKYMMSTLKNKLAARLMELLNPDNICSLLNNPACYTHLELDSAMTQILRCETDRVLTSPQFLLMNADGFLKILKQDGLAVPEIELWRAAIKWGKHRAESEDGQLVRQQLSGLTQYLRLCTLTGNQFCEEVATTGVLSREEMGNVCAFIGMKRKRECLDEICDEVVPRKIVLRGKTEYDKLELEKCEFKSFANQVTYTFTLLTKNHTIELLPLECKSKYRDPMNPKNWTYKVDCTTTITKEENSHDSEASANEPPITVNYSQRVKYQTEFVIPMHVDGKNITLEPDTKYTVNVRMNGTHIMYSSEYSGQYGNDHLTLTYIFQEGRFRSPFSKLLYKALIPE